MEKLFLALNWCWCVQSNFWSALVLFSTQIMFSVLYASAASCYDRLPPTWQLALSMLDKWIECSREATRERQTVPHHNSCLQTERLWKQISLWLFSVNIFRDLSRCDVVMIPVNTKRLRKKERKNSSLMQEPLSLFVFLSIYLRRHYCML